LQSNRIILISDIHYDMLYDSKGLVERYCKSSEISRYSMSNNDFGKFGCNSNKNLLLSSLAKMKEIEPNPSLIILGGDLVAHGIQSLPIKDCFETQHKTIFQLYKILRQFYSDTLILPTTGNNDFTEHYNTPQGLSKLLQYNLWEKVFVQSLKPENLNVNYHETFKTGSYYSYNANSNLTIISLNSNYLNKKNLIIDYELIGYKQLDFLNNTLKNLGEFGKAIIFFHISPFAHLNNNVTQYSWKKEFSLIFDKIVSDFRNKIICSFNSHVHWNEYGIRNVFNNDLYFQTFFIPALSPVYMNNPGFGLLSLDDFNQKINDLQYFYFNLPETIANPKYNLKDSQQLWNITYSYTQDFGIKEFKGEEFVNLFNGFNLDKDVSKLFVSFIGGFRRDNFEENFKIALKNGNIDVDKNHKNFICTKFSFFEEEINKCINS